MKAPLHKRLYHRSLYEISNFQGILRRNRSPFAVLQNGVVPISKAERLFSRGQIELQSIAPIGHTTRLEHCISLMQLAASYLDDVNPVDRGRLFQDISAALQRANGLGANSLDARIESDAPLAFVVSYPRSGNTAIMQTLASALHAQLFDGMSAGLVPFSKAIYPKSYPFVRLIKDHVAHPHYLNDRAVLIIRDGRDPIISLAYMTHKKAKHRFIRKGDLAAFIRWLDTDYLYWGWAHHMRQVGHLLTGPDKKLVRYDEFMSEKGAAVFGEIVTFIDPENGLPLKYLQNVYDGRDAVFENLRKNRVANASWGIGAEFEPDSLFYEWSLNRQGSSWRQSWDKEARKAFHETGATEYLIEYGYETDPDWWRH